jgi:hypothetical protein
MSTRNLPGGKGWSTRKANNLTVICEPIFYKILEPGRLKTLWASTAYYRDSFTSAHILTGVESWVPVFMGLGLCEDLGIDRSTLTYGVTAKGKVSDTHWRNCQHMY